MRYVIEGIGRIGRISLRVEEGGGIGLHRWIQGFIDSDYKKIRDQPVISFGDKNWETKCIGKYVKAIQESPNGGAPHHIVYQYLITDVRELDDEAG